MSPNRVSIGRHPHPLEWMERDEEGSATTDDAQERPPRISGRTLAWLGGAIAALVVLPVVVFGVLLATVDTTGLADRVSDRVSTIANRPVSISDVGIALLPSPGVRLRGVRMENPAVFDGPALADAERVDLAVRLLPLAWGRLEISEARIAGLRMHLGVDEGGTSNFGNFVPAGLAGYGDATDEDENDGVHLLPDRVTVTDATFSWLDVPGERAMLAVGIDARLTLPGPGSGPSPHLRLDLHPDSVHLRTGSDPERIVRLEGPSIETDIVVDPDGASLMIEDGRIRHESMDLELLGSLSGLDADEPRLSLRIQNEAMDASGLTALLDDRMRAERLPYLDGSMDVALRFSAGDPSVPTLVGRVGLRDVSLTLAGERIAEDVRGTLRWDREGLTFSSVEGLFASGPFTLSGVVPADSVAPDVRITGHPDLSVLHAMGALPELSELSGDVAVDLRVEALDSSWPAMRGEIELQGVRAEHRSLASPIYLPVARVRVEGETFEWSETTALLGQQEVITRGTLAGFGAAWRPGDDRPALDVELSATRFDMTEALVPRAEATETSWLHAAVSHLFGTRPFTGAAPRSHVPAILRFDEAVATGTLRIAVDTLVQSSHTLHGLSTTVSATDSALVIDGAEFEAWGGTVTASGYVGVGTSFERPFAMRFEGLALPVTELAALLTPTPSALSGTVDLVAELRGTLDDGLIPVADALAGTIEFTAREGALTGTGVNYALSDFLSDEGWDTFAFDVASVRSVLDGRTIGIESLWATGDQGSVAARGAVAFDGASDLALGLSIPADRLDRISLRRTGVTPAVLERLRNSEQALDLGLRLSGTVSGPELSPDALAATEVADTIR